MYKIPISINNIMNKFIEKGDYMKRILNLIFIFVFTLVLLTGCKCGPKDERTGVAYGVVYNDYVARVEVKVVDGEITDIIIDEALLPGDWAMTDYKDDHDYVVDYNDQRYVKNVMIGDVTFSANVENDNLSWGNDKVSSFGDFLRTGENAQWYYDSLKNNKVSIVDDANKVIKDLKFKTTKMFKSAGDYWKKTDTTLGWDENIKELIKGMKATNLETEPKYNSNNKVVFGETVTGATLSGHKEYYALAKKALENAKSK